MKNNKLAFYADGADSTLLFDKIKEYFEKQCTVIDTMVFSKDPVICRIPNNYAVLPTFFLKFYNGIIVFFTIEDYLNNHFQNLNDQNYLYIDENSIQNIESVNRSMLQNIPMISINKNDQSITEFKLTKI